MLVSEVIDLVAKRLDLDVDDYYTEVMLLFTNDAIAKINNALITVKDPLAKSSITITGVTAKPANFFKTIPTNGYPIIETDTTIGLATGAPASVVVHYLTFKPLLTVVGDTIPLPAYCFGEIVDYVCIHINNDFEANVQQDVGLASTDETLLLSAKGG